MQCYECSGKFCIDRFIPFEIRVRTVTCEPGEICWVGIFIIFKLVLDLSFFFDFFFYLFKRGYTHNDTFRGCSDRECNPTAARFANDSLFSHEFVRWYCCFRSDMCNSAAITRFRRKTEFLILMIHLILVNKMFTDTNLMAYLFWHYYDKTLFLKKIIFFCWYIIFLLRTKKIK